MSMIVGINGWAPHSDAVVVMFDDDDPTKKILWELDAITTGTTRTITMPDADVTLGAVAAGVTAAGTITANRVVVGDDGAKGVKDAAASVTDANLTTVTDGSDASALHVHTVVSLDTTATGANLTALTDGSNATSLHVHAAAIAAGASGFMTGADKTKLDGIEALADVTDATNVAAAGAGMLGTSQAWTKNQYATPTALAITGAGPATIAISPSDSNQFTLALDEAATLSNPDEVVSAGQEWTIAVTQTGGAFALTLGSEYQASAGGITTTTVTTGRRFLLHFHAWSDGDITVVADLGDDDTGYAA